MNTFIYSDNSVYQKPVVIFYCYADSVLEADAAYKAAVGKDPTKQPFIGCQVVPGRQPPK